VKEINYFFVFGDTVLAGVFSDVLIEMTSSAFCQVD
jgi:hypothetical protein